MSSSTLGAELEPELLQAQVEVTTPVCGSLDEVAGHLCRLRGAVTEAAAESGCRMAACGAAPLLRPVPVTDQPRYQAMFVDAPRLVDEQLINGMHVHVAVPDRESAVAVLNRLRPWLPSLVAMAANSPFWDGSETGFASWRTVVFGRWPVSGPPPSFADAADYRGRTLDLLNTGVMRDRGQIYWQARPSEQYPTLEVRATDVQLLPEDAVTLVGVIRGLVMVALRQAAAGVPAGECPMELLSAANWHAARYGMDDVLIDPQGGRRRLAGDLVAELMSHIAPALRETGDLERVSQGLSRLLREGTGAHRQRRALQAGGFAALLDLIGTTSGGLPLPAHGG